LGLRDVAAQPQACDQIDLLPFISFNWLNHHVHIMALTVVSQDSPASFIPKHPLFFIHVMFPTRDEAWRDTTIKNNANRMQAMVFTA
jgi:hypothetical protein